MNIKSPLEQANEDKTILIEQNNDLKRQNKLLADEVAKWKKESTKWESKLLQWNEYRDFEEKHK